MIDKVDVRIPSDAPFHPEFSHVFQDVRSDPTKDIFHGSKHYVAVGDLRPLGYDAILHIGCRHGSRGDHKLELIDTGLMPHSRIITEIERIFEIDAARLPIMRLDLAADVVGVPVWWFQNRLKADHKRYLANVGSTELIEIGTTGIQTLYFGKRPNLYRIYDKNAEYKKQYQQILRKLPPGCAPPSFNDLFGIRDDLVLTRVERQMGGGRIPEALKTIGDLKNADNFCPFDSLKIITGGHAEPNPADFGFTTFCAGMLLREMAERQGMQSTLAFIRKNSGRNTKWALEKFRAFLPKEHEEKIVNTDYLNELYRVSVMRQLAA